VNCVTMNAGLREEIKQKHGSRIQVVLLERGLCGRTRLERNKGL
jgi:hypothetical protein